MRQSLYRLLLVQVFIASTMLSAWSRGKETVTVTGDFTYYVSPDESEKQAKFRALEQARIRALADNFGTYLSMTTSETSATSLNQDRYNFNLFSTSDIAGVWVRTLEEKAETVMECGSIVIHAYVKGEARARDVSAVEFDASVGRVDDNDNFTPASRFVDRERFDISFVSPKSGYLAIYASDGVNDAGRMIPDPMATNAEPLHIKAGTRYRFFQDSNPVMTLGPDEDSALLRFTLLFIPDSDGKPFILPYDSSRISPQGDILGWDVPNAQYQQWLGKLMANPAVQRRDLVVAIDPK